MKYSFRTQTYAEARKLAEDKLGSKDLHISCVLFVKGQPTMRDWVFNTVIE